MATRYFNSMKQLDKKRNFFFKVTRLWRLTIAASKRNVFFTLTDPYGRLKKVATPGLLRKSWVDAETYLKLHNRTQRRKKRNLRMYTNNQKRSPAGYNAAWGLIKTYLSKNDLFKKKFLIILGGPNLRFSRMLLRSVVRRTKDLQIRQILVKDSHPHNGCPLKIKKRKKNKGRNKRRKQLPTRTGHLRKARGAKRRFTAIQTSRHPRQKALIVQRFLHRITRKRHLASVYLRSNTRYKLKKNKSIVRVRRLKRPILTTKKPRDVVWYHFLKRRREEKKWRSSPLRLCR